jgi:hypothetical protein
MVMVKMEQLGLLKSWNTRSPPEDSLFAHGRASFCL